MNFPKCYEDIVWSSLISSNCAYQYDSDSELIIGTKILLCEWPAWARSLKISDIHDSSFKHIKMLFISKMIILRWQTIDQQIGAIKTIQLSENWFSPYFLTYSFFIYIKYVVPCFPEADHITWEVCLPLKIRKIISSTPEKWRLRNTCKGFLPFALPDNLILCCNKGVKWLYLLRISHGKTVQGSMCLTRNALFPLYTRMSHLPIEFSLLPPTCKRNLIYSNSNLHSDKVAERDKKKKPKKHPNKKKTSNEPI